MAKKESEKKMKHFAIRMQSDMYNKLDQESIYHNISVATIIRKAVKEYIERCDELPESLKPNSIQ